MFTGLLENTNFFQGFSHLLGNVPDMAGKQASRFGQGGVVKPGRSHRTLAAHELHAPALAHSLVFTQKDAANLTGVFDVRAAACRQVEVADIDQAQLVFVGARWLAQA